MALALSLWLNRLLSSSSHAFPRPPSTDRKPMEIEVERLPDYLWRDLGFQQPRRAGRGVKRFTPPASARSQVSWHRQGD